LIKVITDAIDSETEKALIEQLERCFSECDAIIVSDYGYGILLSSGQKLQGVQEFIHFLFQVKHDVSQMVEAIAQDAFGFAPMLVELERLDLIEP
jgi:bifunctional ADP-heptose synthase (sugar kinase/adenylyltransferase)